MENYFSNSQLVMITDVKILIDKMKEEGKDYAAIKKACLEKYKDSHWLITNQRQRDEAIAGALFAHAMDDEQRKAVVKLKELTGHILV